jgi:hypothetical protein
LIFIKGTEFFLSYEQYPWFKDAKLKEILEVELMHGSHIHWPSLDVDLSVDMLDNPQKYPLVYR